MHYTTLFFVLLLLPAGIMGEDAEECASTTGEGQRGGPSLLQHINNNVQNRYGGEDIRQSGPTTLQHTHVETDEAFPELFGKLNLDSQSQNQAAKQPVAAWEKLGKWNCWISSRPIGDFRPGARGGHKLRFKNRPEYLASYHTDGERHRWGCVDGKAMDKKVCAGLKCWRNGGGRQECGKLFPSSTDKESCQTEQACLDDCANYAACTGVKWDALADPQRTCYMFGPNPEGAPIDSTDQSMGIQTNTYSYKRTPRVKTEDGIWDYGKRTGTCWTNGRTPQWVEKPPPKPPKCE